VATFLVVLISCEILIFFDISMLRCRNISHDYFFVMCGFDWFQNIDYFSSFLDFSRDFFFFIFLLHFSLRAIIFSLLRHYLLTLLTLFICEILSRCFCMMKYFVIFQPASASHFDVASIIFISLIIAGKYRFSSIDYFLFSYFIFRNTFSLISSLIWFSFADV